MIRFQFRWLTALGLGVVACGEPSAPTLARPGVHASMALPTSALPHFASWLAEEMVTGGSGSAATWPVLAGAGDIAKCYDPTLPLPSLDQAQAQALASPAAATAALLDRIPGTVITLGDNAYEFGSPFDFDACYHPTWGRHRDRTAPSAGNHEYLTGGVGYFEYFGGRSAPPLGYYSYDVGEWHVIVLNSTPQVYACYPPEGDEVLTDPRWPVPQLDDEPTTPTLGRLCAGDVAQQAWLMTDLQANADHQCTVAYFHHPRFSSGRHGNHYQMQRIWDILYAYGVDVVISAHDHDYERFAPQNPDGVRDPAFGIREFVVGTGGGTLRSVSQRIPNSEVAIDDSYGVLALGLGEGGYGWAFVDIQQAVRDSGSDRCHGPPPGVRALRFSIGG